MIQTASAMNANCLAVFWRIDLGMTWPWMWAIAAIGALMSLAAVYYASERLEPRKRFSLAVLRSGALVTALWMFWGWALVQDAVELPELWIAVDESQSMSLPLTTTSDDPSELDSRWSRAWQRLRDPSLQRAIAKRFQVRYVLIGHGSRTITRDELASVGDPTSPRSKLGDDLASLFGKSNQSSVSGYWLVSDGRINEGRSFAAALAANKHHLPVHVTPLGDEARRPDLALQELRATSPAIPGDFVEVTGSLVTTGLAASTVNVRLMDPLGNVLDQKRLEVKAGSNRLNVSLGSVVRKPGRVDWKVFVEPLAEESDATNNEATVAVRVRDRPLSILLVASAASYEFRFLKHLLERSAGVDAAQPLMLLTSILQDSDPRYADQDRSAARLPPSDEARLNAVDVFVLLDADLDGLGETLLKRWAQQVDVGGAGLLMVAGPRHLPTAITGTALAAICPVEPTTLRSEPMGRWRLRVTPFGANERMLKLPATDWGQAPAVHYLPRLEGERIGTQVLLEGIPEAGGTPRDVLLFGRHGAGTVAVQLTDELFRLTTLGGNDQAHEWYWLQLLRRLARGRHAAGDDYAELRVEPAVISLPETANVQVNLGAKLAKAAAGEVRVRVSPKTGFGEGRSVRLLEDPQTTQLWTAELKGFGQGEWQLEIEKPSVTTDVASARWEVVPLPTELSETRGDQAALVELATLSAGEVLELEQPVERWLEQLPQVAPISIRSFPPQPLWNHSALISWLIVLLVTEWGLRRWWGLP